MSEKQTPNKIIVLKGRYNNANVLINEIDISTKLQILSFLNHPAFQHSYISIMPDCHAGKGVVIGFTMSLNDYIIPNVVGVDIGCGVDTYRIGKKEIDFEKLDKFIRNNVPYGFNIHEKKKDCMFDLNLDFFKLNDIVEKLKFNKERAELSLGTLGGGNHFIEIDKDSEGTYWLTIHSGSRNLGLQVANYHQRIAKELMKKMLIGDLYKDLEFLPMDIGGEEYLDDVEIIQDYAEANRDTIANIILGGFFKVSYISTEQISSVHNYVGIKDKIIRKGAISAHENEAVIIPLNMRDGIIIGKGRGNKLYNNSAPHGAGRILSRKKAKTDLKLDDFKKSMEGIWSSSVNEKTLDEAPMAYKNTSKLLEYLVPTVNILEILKPVYNFKSDK